MNLNASKLIYDNNLFRNTHHFKILLFKCLLQEEFRQYEIDWNGPVGTGDDNIVEVFYTLCSFSDHILSLLRQSDHPSSDDGNYGIPFISILYLK